MRSIRFEFKDKITRTQMLAVFIALNTNTISMIGDDYNDVIIYPEDD